MENIQTHQLSAFTTEYNKAKVKVRETLWSKALMTSPLFSSSSNLSDVSVESDLANALIQAEQIKDIYNFKEVTFSKNASTVILDKKDLEGTQYKSFVFYGYQLNTNLHFLILNYMIEILHQQMSNFPISMDYSSTSTVTIDVDLMIKDLGLDTKSKGFYKEVLYDLNSRLSHSSTRFEMVNGNIVNDRYVYKFGYDENKNVFSTVFGDIFIESIIKDTWKLKVDYLSQMALNSGTTRILFNLLNALARIIEVNRKKKKVARISVNTAIKTLGLTGNRKTNVRTLNEAFAYLKEIGFVENVDDEKSGNTVTVKNVYLNSSFDLVKFAEKLTVRDKSAGKKDIEVEYTVIEETDYFPNVVEPTFVASEESLTTDQHLAKIVMTMAKIGINPEALKASIPEQAVDVENSDSPAPAEIDPWNVVPDFDAWERESDNSPKPEHTPRKVWSDDEIYSQFD
ncbi:hypothetical protein L4P95_006155 [Pseudomonas aeruginosa]|nr:hypothetical protein [Pseudomonas aeruginosa]